MAIIVYLIRKSETEKFDEKYQIQKQVLYEEGLPRKKTTAETRLKVPACSPVMTLSAYGVGVRDYNPQTTFAFLVCFPLCAYRK